MTCIAQAWYTYLVGTLITDTVSPITTCKPKPVRLINHKWWRIGTKLTYYLRSCLNHTLNKKFDRLLNSMHLGSISPISEPVKSALALSFFSAIQLNQQNYVHLYLYTQLENMLSFYVVLSALCVSKININLLAWKLLVKRWCNWPVVSKFVDILANEILAVDVLTLKVVLP